MVSAGLVPWAKRYRRSMFGLRASHTCRRLTIQTFAELTRERFLAGRTAIVTGSTSGIGLCPAYIADLIGPGDRKSIQPMAARDSGVSYDRLHHFIASGIWDEEPLEAALLAEADRQVAHNAGR